MTDRTLDGTEQLNVRKPTYEMQAAALAAGYSNVRDWVLDAACDEIRDLKARVDDLEREWRGVLEEIPK